MGTPSDRLSGPHAPSHEFRGRDPLRFLDTSVLTSGVLDLARIPAMDTARIPDLPASTITSGVLDLARIPAMDAARIPDLPASRITSGVLDLARLPARVVWKDESEDALTLNNVTSSIAWTELDLSDYVSARAKFAYMMVLIKPDVVGSGKVVSVRLQKTGTTPGAHPGFTLLKAAAQAGEYPRVFVLAALDEDQTLEYYVYVTSGWQIDVTLSVLGYVE